MLHLRTVEGKAVWFRASEYTVADGYIQVAAGAQIETYDPLEEYASSCSGLDRSLVPYAQLLRVLAAQGSKSDEPSKKAVKAVLGFCHRFGLLGILPHTVESVTFPPRWTPDLDGKEPLPAEEVLYFEAGIWNRTRTYLDPVHLPRNAVVGDIVREEEDRAHVVLRPLTGKPESPRSEPLEAWSRFFPSIPADEKVAFKYPTPADLAFWQSYAEPFDEFIQAAWLLFHALGGRSARRRRQDQDGPERSEEPRALSTKWLTRLSRLYAPVLRVTERDEAKQAYVTVLRGKSLLALLAQMAAWDLETCGSPKLCAEPGCGTPYLSRMPHQRFCTQQCRSRDLKARQRSRPGQSAKDPDQ